MKSSRKFENVLQNCIEVFYILFMVESYHFLEAASSIPGHKFDITLLNFFFFLFQKSQFYKCYSLVIKIKNFNHNHKQL